MNRIYTAAAVGLLALGVMGCASVFEGTSQEISVGTSPPGATCTFERNGTNIGTITSTPGTLVVRKSKYDITIKCTKDGYQEASYKNESGTTATVAANVAVDLLLTLGISSIIDSANGADNYYEPAVNVVLIPNSPGAGPGASNSAPTVVPAAAMSAK